MWIRRWAGSRPEGDGPHAHEAHGLLLRGRPRHPGDKAHTPGPRQLIHRQLIHVLTAATSSSMACSCVAGFFMPRPSCGL